MGCPVHVWAPLMGSLVPLARLARDRLQWPAKGSAAPSAEAPAEPSLQRFSPVWSQPTDRPPDP